MRTFSRDMTQASCPLSGKFTPSPTKSAKGKTNVIKGAMTFHDDLKNRVLVWIIESECLRARFHEDVCYVPFK